MPHPPFRSHHPHDADRSDVWRLILFFAIAALAIGGLLGVALGDEPPPLPDVAVTDAPEGSARYGQETCLAVDWPHLIYSSREACLMARDAVEGRVDLIVGRLKDKDTMDEPQR